VVMMSEEEQIIAAWEAGTFRVFLDRNWCSAVKKSEEIPRTNKRLDIFETLVETTLKHRYHFKRNRDYTWRLWTTDNRQHAVCEFVFDFDPDGTVYRHVTGMKTASSIHSSWFDNGRAVSI